MNPRKPRREKDLAVVLLDFMTGFSFSGLAPRALLVFEMNYVDLELLQV